MNDVTAPVIRIFIARENMDPGFGFSTSLFFEVGLQLNNIVVDQPTNFRIIYQFK